MLLLHMQEIVFVDSQEGLLFSRGGGGGPDILAPGLQLHPGFPTSERPPRIFGRLGRLWAGGKVLGA